MLIGALVVSLLWLSYEFWPFSDKKAEKKEEKSGVNVDAFLAGLGVRVNNVSAAFKAFVATLPSYYAVDTAGQAYTEAWKDLENYIKVDNE